jgi:hypothetical protein
MFKVAFGAAFLLTLATWVFFYIKLPDAPLGPAATTVVFGSWFIIALIGKWVWTKIQKRGEKSGQKT